MFSDALGELVGRETEPHGDVPFRVRAGEATQEAAS